MKITEDFGIEEKVIRLLKKEAKEMADVAKEGIQRGIPLSSDPSRDALLSGQLRDSISIEQIEDGYNVAADVPYDEYVFYDTSVYEGLDYITNGFNKVMKKNISIKFKI